MNEQNIAGHSSGLDIRDHALEFWSVVVTRGSTYDEYGRPGASNTGYFQYTGQGWLPQAGLYNYKARVYDPKIGRFLQTDPILYNGGMNLYAYVGNDPVNATDPSGLQLIWGPTVNGPTATDRCSFARSCNSYDGPLDVGLGTRGDGFVYESDFAPLEGFTVSPAPQPPPKIQVKPPPLKIPWWLLRGNALGAAIWALTPNDTACDDYSEKCLKERDESKLQPFIRFSDRSIVEQDCRNQCTYLLHRPYRFPGDDRNTFDYHKCVNRCMKRHGY